MTMLMEPNTGVVDSIENWKADWEMAKERNELEEMGWEETWEAHLESGRLVEVED